MKYPKAIQQARNAGYIVQVLTFRYQTGQKVRRKGYAITRPGSTHETATAEPVSYPAGSIYSRDKWKITNDTQPLRWRSRLTFDLIK